MARYIDADVAIELHNGKLWAWDVCDLEEFLADVPTADVTEARNGEWLHGDTIDDGWTRYYCSECEWMTESYYKEKCDLSNYCPNCGAKMDGKGDDDETDCRFERSESDGE